MTDQLTDLHNYLRGCCPASGGTIMSDIQLTRKADEKAAALLPKDAVELTTALHRLSVAGLVVKGADGLVYWKAEAAKVEQSQDQKVLFA